MAITFVQSKSGNGTGWTPTLPAAVGAGHLLVLGAIVQAGVPTPASLTDSLGNTYSLLSGDTSPAQSESCALWYCWNSKAGSPTLTLPFTAPGAWALHEFAGVQAVSDPADDVGSVTQIGKAVSVSYFFSQGAELFFGIGLSTTNVLITPPAVGTIVETQQSDNGSLRSGWGIAPNNRQGGTATWQQGSTAPLCGYWATFLHA